MMLTIDWPGTDAEGWTDYIPMAWFVRKGRRGDLMHQIVGPQGMTCTAHCIIEVRDLSSTIDYGGPNATINSHTIRDTGTMKIEFNDRERRSVKRIFWREANDSQFQSDGIMFGLQEDDIALVEGGPKLVQHMRIERRPELARRKKTDMLAARGHLECEACDVDLRSAYGEGAQACYEAHHDIPLAKRGVCLNTPDDLKILCANCHRAIHKTVPMMTVKAFRQALEKI